MAYRTSFSLLNTEKLNDITVKSGNYSSTFTYPYENAEGTIPASECNSDSNMIYSISCTILDIYNDESSAEYTYQFEFRQDISSGSNGNTGTSAAAWSLEGIQLLSSGYLPLTLTNDNYNNLMFVHPSIQIPNITINGNDYWESHKSQYNEMIDKSITPLTIDLKGYPVNNTISIVDPTDEYYFVNNDYEIFDEDTLNKSSSINVKIGKTPQFCEIPFEIDSDGVLKYPSTSFSFNIPSNVTKIDDFRYIFQYCSSLTSVNMDNIEEIENMYECFYHCSGLTSVSMNNLSKIGNNGLGSCFSYCTSLTTVPSFDNITELEHNYDMSGCFYNCTSLTTAPTFASLNYVKNSALQNCFQGCTSLTTAPAFANLKNMDGYTNFSFCFSDCTSLTTAPTFDNLISIGDDDTFNNCFKNTKITSLSFPKLNQISFGNYTYTSHFDNMLSGVDGCTVHFPSNLQSVIGSWSDVTDGFGGTNTTVLFDLPATIGYKAFSDANNNSSPRDYKVFLQTPKPQVGDSAWVFPENNNRTSYDINAEDVIQTTILSSASTEEYSVWYTGNYLYVRLNGHDIYITPTNQNRWNLCYLV